MFKNTFVSGFLSIFYSLGSDPLQLWAKRVGLPDAHDKASDGNNIKGVSGSNATTGLVPPQTTHSTTGGAVSTTTTSTVSSIPTTASTATSSITPSSSATTAAAPTTTTIANPDPHVQLVIDDTLNSQVLELVSPNLTSTFITCPALATRTLGIKLPFLVMLIKNLNKYWSFEVTILDDRGEKRRFRASNFQSVTRVKPYITTMPLRMDPGWNHIQLNLADYTKRAYGTSYAETLRVTIHANCRLRRVYFADRIVPENELPAEFKLFLPIVKSG